MIKKKLLLCIPCFNEADSILRVIKEIKEIKLYDFDILVIDDGSSDNTYLNAKKIVNVCRHHVNLGIGGAIQTGLKYASKEGYEFFIQIDGDGQHIPKEISKLIKCQKSNFSDITIGSRYIKNDTFRSSALRRFGIKIISFYINILFNKKITDPTSGMRLLNKKAIKLFANNYPVDFPEPLSNAIAIKYNLKLKETPVKMRSRKTGKSSIYGFKSLVYMLRVLSYLTLIKINI
jgi:glycosyltransferase involved in cell wall biosynthesis